MKKWLSLLLLLAFSLAAVPSLASQEAEFTIPYPSYMTASEGEALALPQKPERIVCLSNAALQALVRADIQPIAITNPSGFVPYPDWVAELPVIATGPNTLDVEAIIALEPNLVIMGVHLKENFSQQLKDAGIPIYYTSEGPSITYTETKEEAITLTGAFGSEGLAQALEAEFAAVEQRAAAYVEAHDTRTMMILFAAPPSYQQTSKGYLGSILSMLPFENLSDALIGAEARTAPLDMEQLVEMNPEFLFAISPTNPTAESLREVNEAEYEKNPAVWKELSAIRDGRILYLSTEYVTSKGMHIIQSIDSLIDMLEQLP